MDVIKAASTKWNFNVFYPGPGVGGHCLPVDPYYLVKKAKELGYHAQVITAGRSVNNSMPEHMVGLIQSALNEFPRVRSGKFTSNCIYCYCDKNFTANHTFRL